MPVRKRKRKGKSPGRKYLDELAKKKKEGISQEYYGWQERNWKGPAPKYTGPYSQTTKRRIRDNRLRSKENLLDEQPWRGPKQAKPIPPKKRKPAKRRIVKKRGRR